jgi:TfoX/Sxy family transcriptional regulator of competence genes
MAFQEDFAATVRAALVGAGVSALREVKMFGGIAFLLNGNMVAAASNRGLLVRVGKDRRSDALAEHGARPMVMRGRNDGRYIYIDPPVPKDRALQKWFQLAVAFVQTLPPKPARQSSAIRAKGRQ